MARLAALHFMRLKLSNFFNLIIYKNMSIIYLVSHYAKTVRVAFEGEYCIVRARSGSLGRAGSNPVGVGLIAVAQR